MARIDEIAGIDAKDATKLRKAGIRTTESLLKRGGAKGSRDQLAADAGVDPELILRWAHRADMMRVPGIGSEYALLLEMCGVSTIKELRRRNAGALAAKLSDSNGRKPLVRRLPTEAMVISWIAGRRRTSSRLGQVGRSSREHKGVDSRRRVRIRFGRPTERSRLSITVTNTTRSEVLAAAKDALIESGYGQLSTRRIAEQAEVPLSQIHYHFGSKQNLILAVLEEENQRLLARQTEMYSSEAPLWKRWEQACDFLDQDIASGYVRILQEMIAAGWSNPEVAAAVRSYLKGWFDLLREVATSALGQIDGSAQLDPSDVAALVGAAFFGAEAMILLGFEERGTRKALRSVGGVIRRLETGR